MHGGLLSNIMSPVSWVKKKLGRRKTRSLFPRSSFRQPSADCLSVPLVEREIHIAAEDLRSANSHKTADMFSDIDDLESIVLHIKENKVTLIRRKSAMSKVSGRRQANGNTAFYRNLYRRASRIARFSSLTCMGINGMLLPKKSKYDYH